MKKSTITLLALIGVFAVLIGVYLGVSHAQQKKQEQEEQESEAELTIISMETTDATAFSYMNRDMGIDLSFTKTDGEWVCDQYPDYPMDEDKINDILGEIVALKADRVIKEGEFDPESSDYGFSDPEAVVTVTNSDGTQTVTIGGMVSVYYYCMKDGSGDLYTITNDLMLAIDRTALDLVAYTKLPGINSSGVSRIEMQYDGSTYVYTANEVETSSTDESGSTTTETTTVWTAEKDGERFDLDSSSIETAVDDIASISQQNCIVYGATDDDLAKYGLDDPYITFTIDYLDVDGNAATVVIRIGDMDDTGEIRYINFNDVSEITSVEEVFDENLLPLLLGSSDAVHDDQVTTSTTTTADAVDEG
ncbi:MAG: DUF4340 domain-containing protein [Oscillospiraceae bacterium]|jgi:hypothetical protein